jgi:hypothetical protein
MLITVKVTWWRVVVAILGIDAIFMFHNSWNRDRNRPESVRVIENHHRFKSFALRIKRFQMETGNYPTNCVQLAGTNNLDWISYYFPRLEYTACNPVEINDSQINIDSLVAYTICCKNGILAYEKRSVWRDGKVWVCYDDMTFVRIPYKELVKRLEGSETP